MAATDVSRKSDLRRQACSVNKLAHAVTARQHRRAYRSLTTSHEITMPVHVVPQNELRAAERMAGWSLITAAVGFMAVFGYLAARFDYPRVLDGSAADVLPRLLALGDAGRAVWVVYALLPLLLIPAAVGAHAVLRDSAPTTMRLALVSGIIAAISMLLGLARWPSVHWELARAWATASPDARQAIDAVFRGLNSYLGTYIGEFLGELSLNGFFVFSGIALLRAGRRWAGYGGLAAGVIGLVAALRNTTTVVAPIAALDNSVLPLWLIVLGVVLLRGRRLSS